MLKREAGLSKPVKVMNECLNVLLDEIQQAYAWSRPSILLAVHQSKSDQIRAISAMESKLIKLNMEIVHITLGDRPIDAFDSIIPISTSEESIFFIQNLGEQTKTYEGLNMSRELFIEKRLKLIFWLTREELLLLSRRAPDFWAFRHRVIEFSTGHSSKKNILPSGVLLWHFDKTVPDLKTVYEKIAYQEGLLKNIPVQGEAITNHAYAVENLAYYFWLVGENQKVNNLLHQEFKQIESFDLKDVQSRLLNALAINCFDQGNYRDAFQWIEQALELNSKQSLIWSNYGVICRSAGQGRKSLSSLMTATKLNPASFESFGVLGYVHMSLGKYASALSYFEKALSLHSESVHFYPAVAVCQSRMGNIERLGKTVQRISDAARDNGYFSVCTEGLSGNISSALSRLKELTMREKIPLVFVRRDPNLHLIFGAAALRELF